MNMPKLYHPVNIKFWSLRNFVGEGLGVIPDCDTQVERVCMRVRDKSGWKWQVHDINRIREWDYGAEQDQEILDECRGGLEFEIV